ncbi:unnamed protein product [Spirodela intermedia]|uniref:Uncharacterized protein n=1 Tax=Spirodela intermedia TaxID=51605 RepID=A0A7I8IJB9_SPIIN|nr:unnamed protein product [Spirodela intermedia]CAA6657976.1 unnamed protein product [Spirodela intermedia]
MYVYEGFGGLYRSRLGPRLLHETERRRRTAAAVELPASATKLCLAVQWNALLRRRCRAGQWAETLALFRRMAAGGGGRRRRSPEPDRFTLSIVLKACGELCNLREGRSLHGYLLRRPQEELRRDLFVGAALVEMYSRCGEMGGAAAVFNAYPSPDVALWTAVISAVSFFSLVLREKKHLNPNPRTLVSLIAAVTQIGAPLAGKSAHCYSLRRAFLSDLPLSNSVLNMYSKLGNADYVVRFFAAMAGKDVISWSCVLGFYARHGRTAAALELYQRMTAAGFRPNSVTVIGALQACAAAAELPEGRKLHGEILRRGLELQAAVATALIDMYMKCSCSGEAELVFSGMPTRDVVTWSAMVGGYSQSGLPDMAMEVFRRMMMEGTKPDAVAMAKLLSSCSQSGLLRQALCLHGFLLRRGFHRRRFVVAALIDLYSKCGAVELAVGVFTAMREKDAVVWSAMIAGFGINGLPGDALRLFREMIRSSAAVPGGATFASLLSACSHSGLLREGKEIFEEMEVIHGVAPAGEHVAAMVDLLGRAGELPEALEADRRRSIDGGAAAEVGELAARKLSELGADDMAGPYLPLLQVFAANGRWEQVGMVRKTVEDRLLRKIPGRSSIEVAGGIHWFAAGDQNHQEIERTQLILRGLGAAMKEGGGSVDDDAAGSTVLTKKSLHSLDDLIRFTAKISNGF